MRVGGWKRWLRFNTVGAIGILVQLGALWGLTGLLEIHYLPSTLAAVELAILHNFLWHERWTWKDRSGTGLAGRLARFNLTTGLVSLAGNLALMPLLIHTFDLSVIPSNVIAIACCSVANFLLADRMVFVQRRRGAGASSSAPVSKIIAPQSLERSAFCGATRPLPLKRHRPRIRGKGRVAPQNTLRSRLCSEIFRP